MKRHLFNRSKDIRRTILVADDEEINRQILKRNLGRFYDIIEASDGQETLERIRRSKGELSLIMLDLNMPRMTGYEVLEAMQQEEDLQRLPVIVLTSEKEAEIESLQLGAVDFLEKGRDMPEVVVARVQRSIELAEDTQIIRDTEDDELTGLYNRKFFFEYAALMRGRGLEQPMDAVALNVDRFHILNEIYGRSFGDELLRALAQAARQALKVWGGLASRTEADTFLIYCRHIEDPGQLLRILEEEIRRLEHASAIRVRIGICSDPLQEMPPEHLFDRAVSACHSIPGNVTEQVAYYNESIHERQRFEQRLVADFQRALAGDEIKVYFQPQFHIHGEDRPVLASAEALVRWEHPELGLLSPDQFIPIFEKNGLIRRLDQYVWRRTARHMSEWKKNDQPILPVSINLSRVDLFDDELEERLIGLVEEFGLKPEEYMLEITESACAVDMDQMVAKLNRLRDRGFVIEMDDFGTGYSSLNALTEIPLDVLKVDMKFARQLTADEQSHKMISIIMEIAEWLSVETIAEGIETEEQLRIFKSLGCDTAQGYYFSKALPAEKFEQMLRTYFPKEESVC
ncbi:MAG: EAL domain-containing protein [Firmicutes bacterium]|nr:EAL domain-containing protein [Bacillota bacterium]